MCFVKENKKKGWFFYFVNAEKTRLYNIDPVGDAAGEIHLSRSDKLQSATDRVEQIATIDVPLQNGGTKSQEENQEAGKSIALSFFFFPFCLYSHTRDDTANFFYRHIIYFTAYHLLMREWRLIIFEWTWNFFRRVRASAIGLAKECWLGKKNYVDYYLAYSSGIHVHDTRLWQTQIQEMVSHHVSHVYRLDWIS